MNIPKVGEGFSRINDHHHHQNCDCQTHDHAKQIKWSWLIHSSTPDIDRIQVAARQRLVRRHQRFPGPSLTASPKMLGDLLVLYTLKPLYTFTYRRIAYSSLWSLILGHQIPTLWGLCGPFGVTLCAGNWRTASCEEKLPRATSRLHVRILALSNRSRFPARVSGAWLCIFWEGICWRSFTTSSSERVRIWDQMSLDEQMFHILQREQYPMSSRMIVTYTFRRILILLFNIVGSAHGHWIPFLCFPFLLCLSLLVAKYSSMT